MLWFDVTPLSFNHLVLFLSCFVASWIGGMALVSFKPFFLRVKVQPHIIYGGIGLGVVIAAALAYVLRSHLVLLGSFFIALAVIGVAGTWDERSSLSSWRQLLWQVVAALVVVSGGWVIPYITNPFDVGVLSLQWFTFGPWILPSAVISIIWLVAVMNAVNWLDGVDGLASGVALVVFITLVAISILPATQDSLTASLAIVGIAALLGFFIWNAPPAKIYLGTVGSWLLGLYIGMVAMTGGGKIMTTMLVLAWPIVDAAIVIGERLLATQKPWIGDKRHFHFRLQAQGISTWRIVGSAMTVAILLSIAAIFLPTAEKILVFVFLGIIMTMFVFRIRKAV